MTAPMIEPKDQPARARIRAARPETLFVEAGAGTGKTSELVKRVVELVGRGDAAMDSLAIITFTRDAASELRERVRSGLEESLSQNTSDGVRRGNIESALDQIDYASIQTIDSFALSLLRERPLEAGLPPEITSMDEMDSVLDFGEQWNTWLRNALDSRAEFADLLDSATMLGMRSPTDTLRSISESFHENYDLLDEAILGDPDTGGTDGVDAVLTAASHIEKLLEYCDDPGSDGLIPHVNEFFAFVQRLDNAEPDSLISELMSAPRLRVGNAGAQGNWRIGPDGRKAHMALRDELVDVREAVKEHLGRLRREVLGKLAAEAASFALNYAASRRTEGLAGFQDIVIWANELLHTPNGLEHFRERYRHVIVDEFQDTDRTQISLVRRLAEGLDSGGVDPGRLFVVGDPKQSIYGWRRADLREVMQVRNEYLAGLVNLTENFRSHDGIVHWVNQIFEQWIGPDETEHQPRYVNLQTSIPAPGPDWGVSWIGSAVADSNVGDVRIMESDQIAQICAEIANGGWGVRNESGNPSVARLRDTAILMRTTTGLASLEKALEDAGIPYTLSGKSLAYSTQEVRDLIAALGAIDNPSDGVALAAALRSAAYGCSDVELWEWVAGGGRLDYMRPGGGRGPVADALESLRELHVLRTTLSTAELIEQFVRERRLRELALPDQRARERWGRIELLIEDARSLAVANRPTLRQFLVWVGARTENRTRVADTTSASIEDDIVRIMTVHTAKGLEFPIVILTGIASGGGSTDQVLFGHDGPPESRIGLRFGPEGQRFESRGYEDLAEASGNREELESARLMYVACTRAKDHLVVSLYRTASSSDNSITSQFVKYADSTNARWHELVPRTSGQLRTTRDDENDPSNTVHHGPQERAEWIQRRASIIEHAKRSLTVTASSLQGPHDVPSAEKTGDEQIEMDPWRRGRAASSIGRAVHAVLQDIDLTKPDTTELGALAAKHSRAHDVTGFEEEILRLAKATLETPVMQRAAEALAKGRAWRESYVSAPVGDSGLILEGYVDLLFEDDDRSLVIVDYKTDRTTDTAEAYELQLGGYIAAVRRATGREVSQAVLVFSRRAAGALRDGTSLEAAQHSVSDLDQSAERAIKLAEERSSAG